MKQIALALIGLFILSAGAIAYAENLNSENIEINSENVESGSDLSHSNFSHSDLSYTSISKPQYFVGSAVPLAVPIFGVLLGGYNIPTFGIGHAIQGRYMSRGWIFTAGELFSLGVGVYFILSLSRNLGDTMSFSQFLDFPHAVNTDTELAVSGMIISAFSLLGFMIWEAIDVWLLPSHIKVSNSPFELSPALMASGFERGFGLSLKYKF